MIVFDCEIENAILMRGEIEIEGIKYCGGWRDFKGMGLSVIGVYDYKRDQSRVFCRDNFAEFQDLVCETDAVVGFNNIAFDNQLCAAHGIKVPDEKSYDVLVEIWKAAGLGPKFAPKTHGGYGLDAVCKANFNINKTGHGAMAPVDWQRGRIGKVIDYCLMDTMLCRMLYDFIKNNGEIINPKNPTEKLEFDIPWGCRSGQV